MLRRLITLLSVGSLLLCVAACVLWVRSVRLPDGMRDQASWVWRGRRYTAWSMPGRVLLWAPPAAPPGMDVARQTAEPGIRNVDIVWTVSADDQTFSKGLVVIPRARGPSEWLNRRSAVAGDASRRASAEVTPILLLALQDPERFAAAHYGLVELQMVRSRRVDAERQADGPIHYRLDGLDVELRDPYDERSDSSDTHWADFKATVDPAQRLALCAQWHRRLDVIAGAMPWWAAASATGVLPVAWLSTCMYFVLRRWLRRLSIRCPTCGYDLRATPGRCPECGTLGGGPVTRKKL